LAYSLYRRVYYSALRSTSLLPETKPKFAITIRELNGIDDLKQVQSLEREVWDLADIDALALPLAVASLEAGAIWLAAFDDNKMAGFAFAFPAITKGHVTFHSHQVAVRTEYRDSDLGYKLKLAQRDRVLGIRPGENGVADRVPESGPSAFRVNRISEITWTFDPLQSKNAHLNFSKLGVISDNYKIDLYGPETSSTLHRNGTDRLWVRWPITSRRVDDRLSKKKANLRTETLDALSTVQPLILFGGDGRPVRADLDAALRRQRVAIEIPSEINSVERTDADLAREWRLATRWAFTESIKAGFHVAEFCRMIRGQQGPGAYLLEKARIEEYWPELRS
jgi:predicted GNAT superfamily acetyltransferase